MDDAYLIVYYNEDDMTAKVLDIYYSRKAVEVALDKRLLEYRKPDRPKIPEEEYLRLVTIPVDILDNNDLIALPDDEADFSTYTYFEESEDITGLGFARI